MSRRRFLCSVHSKKGVAHLCSDPFGGRNTQGHGPSPKIISESNDALILEVSICKVAYR
jgi:hypothetical protein